MKKLSLLRDWTKVLFVLCLFPVVFVPPILLLLLLAPQMVPDMKLTSFDSVSLASVTAMLVMYIGYCLFVYALYLLRKVLALFAKNRIFDDEVIAHLAQIGRLIYYGLLLTTIPVIIYRLFTQNPVKVSLDTGAITKIVAVITLGLFFTVLSEVFKKAKQLKEENELTI